MIKPAISLIFAVITVLILTGCINTEGTLRIQGKVLDEKTHTGISYRNVFIQAMITGNNERPIPHEAGQFVTDSTGAFSYSLKKMKGAYNYSFSIVGDSVYPYTSKNITLATLKREAKYINLYVSRLADLTIFIIRKSNKPVEDTLSLRWESNGIYGWILYPYKIHNYGKSDDAAELTSDKELRWIGGNIHSRIKTKVFADKRTLLRWNLYRYGKRREFIDTITCKRDLPNILNFTY